jgi:acetylornithine/succinyldiaminopimelate/putrescine aminotransferase
VEYNNIEAIKAATTDKTCAVMLESVQGEGGVNFPTGNYLKDIRDWCDEKTMLLMLDEIQTGIGRMGTLFAYKRYGIEPDVMTLAKGLGGGFPIGAILAKERASVFVPGEHGSTFGGNPVTCAAAYATVKFILENGISQNAGKVGKYLIDRLNGLKRKFPLITDVRGGGLLVGVDFSREIAGLLLTECLGRGLLVNRLKPDTLRFMPPLIIGNEDVDKAIRILDEALSVMPEK